MGTSTSNKGQKGETPAVPTWVDEEESDDVEKDTEEDEEIAEPEDNRRFSAARGNFTRFVNSGCSDTADLRRATSDYVSHSLSGSGNAVARLGASNASSIKVVSLFGSIARNGLESALKEFGLDHLVGKSKDELFDGFVDFICSDGGSINEGIARDSLIETFIDMEKQGVADIEGLNDDQVVVIAESFFSNVIMERLINDIGMKAIKLPDDVQKV